jgi:hypothetical protein
MKNRELEWALVPRVIAEEKSLGVSLQGLVQWISAQGKPLRGNRGDWNFEHETRAANGNLALVRMNLSIKARSRVPESWTCALIMFGVRVDGVDHRAKHNDGYGGVCRGWHRHAWNTSRLTSEGFLKCLPDFSRPQTLEQFIHSCCTLLSIKLSEGSEDDNLRIG